MSSKSRTVGSLGLNRGVFGITVLFGGAGVLAYLTFGDQIQTVVLVNLDPRSKMVQAVSLLELKEFSFGDSLRDRFNSYTR